ncbi:MAG: hypothetical protein M3Z28_09790 [Candidatus Dormibacteraeota bacterium]|nr:hypothetical protein [Candidatus Dormibacteraeota bacterium]
MLKLGSRPKALGTPVLCPACRHPNLGIDIWCERCRWPLDWNGQKPVEALPLVAAASPPSAMPRSETPASAPIVAPEPPDPPATEAIATVVPEARPARAFRPPRLSMPALTWPKVAMPRFTLPRLRAPRVPRLRVPQVPRIGLVVAAILAVLLIVPLAYVLLPAGRAAVARQAAASHLPSTNAAPVVDTAQAAAIAGVSAKTHLPYRTGKCAANAPCLTVASQTTGKDAAAVVFSTASSAARQCVAYVYRGDGHWHFLDAVCGLPDQLSPMVNHDATVHVPGNCANVRDGASLNAGVIACLKDGNTVHIDGGPTYADGRLWWHEPQGWMAHDFLTGP